MNQRVSKPLLQAESDYDGQLYPDKGAAHSDQSPKAAKQSS